LSAKRGYQMGCFHSPVQAFMSVSGPRFPRTPFRANFRFAMLARLVYSMLKFRHDYVRGIAFCEAKYQQL
jgi:hypothetical protein